MDDSKYNGWHYWLSWQTDAKPVQICSTKQLPDLLCLLVWISYWAIYMVYLTESREQKETPWSIDIDHAMLEEQFNRNSDILFA